MATRRAHNTPARWESGAGWMNSITDLAPLSAALLCAAVDSTARKMGKGNALVAYTVRKANALVRPAWTLSARPTARDRPLNNIAIPPPPPPSLAQGCAAVFALTTRTSHYFIERGFKETTLDALPAEKVLSPAPWPAPTPSPLCACR